MIYGGRHIVVTVAFVPQDFWVGGYWDDDGHRLFICPLPCVAFCVQPALHSPLRAWFQQDRRRAWARLREGARSYVRMCWRYRRPPRWREAVRSAIGYELAEREREESQAALRRRWRPL